MQIEILYLLLCISMSNMSLIFACCFCIIPQSQEWKNKTPLLYHRHTSEKICGMSSCLIWWYFWICCNQWHSKFLVISYRSYILLVELYSKFQSFQIVSCLNSFTWGSLNRSTSGHLSILNLSSFFPSCSLHKRFRQKRWRHVTVVLLIST